MESHLIYFQFIRIEDRNKQEVLLKINFIVSSATNVLNLLYSFSYVIKINLNNMDSSKDHPNLSLSTMVILGRLGRGGTSHVFKAQSTKNKKLYAMKVIDKKDKNYNRPALQRQLNIHKRLDNAYVIRLQGHFQDSDNHYVLTEYCQGGQMTRFITQELSEQKIANIIYQIALGLQYLHNLGIAHCDIKLSNMLIHKGRIKICDFGFSQNLNDPTVHQQKSLCGTLYYLAPEILKQKRRIHHKQSDIWGIGISLLVLLTKKQPYLGQNFQTLRKQILAGQRQKLPLLSPQLTNLIQKMLDMNPQSRISLNQILTHPFLLKYTSKINYELTTSKGYSKEQQKLNDKIEVVSRLTSQSQSEEKDTLVRAKQEEQSNKSTEQFQKIKEWKFKRSPTSNQQQGSDNTVSKKTLTKIQYTDHDKTVRNSKSNKQQETKFSHLTPIQAALIKPFEEFYYQTKNEGFIHIFSDAHIAIKVKNITYQISSDGQTLTLLNKQIKLKQINSKSNNLQYKQPYQLYAYAKEMIDILKSKKYAISWSEKYKDQDLIFGISLDWKKIKCLSICKDKATLLQWIGNEDYIIIKRRDQKTFRKSIDQIQDWQPIFILMKDYYLQKTSKEKFNDIF